MKSSAHNNTWLRDLGDVAAGTGKRAKPTADRSVLASMVGEICRDEFSNPITRAWLQRAFCLHRDTGESLDSALGLKAKPSGRKWQTGEAYDTRDGFLREAWILSGGGDFKKFAVAVDTFGAICWPAWRGKSSAPRTAGALERLLFAAFKATDGRVPKKWRRLRDVLQRAPASCCTAAAPEECDA